VHESTPANVLRRPLASSGNKAAASGGAPQRVPTAPTHRPAKSGAATRARRQERLRAARSAKEKARQVRSAERRRNRKRTNWPRVLLGIACTALVAECVAALLWSPRLWVKRVVVSGNDTVPTELLVKRLGIKPQSNILRLPVGRLRTAAEAEPAVEKVELHRDLPDTVRLVVTERRPWASVRIGNGPVCYTIDRNLIPFRQAKAPEPGLPRIVLAPGEERMSPVLGRRLNAPGLASAGQCLAWAYAHGSEFPLEKVSIDPWGKLCLNRVGGVAVRLGSGMDLDKKLATLDLLLQHRTDLRGTGSGPVAAVNLIAYDAPALVAAAKPPASDVPAGPVVPPAVAVP